MMAERELLLFLETKRPSGRSMRRKIRVRIDSDGNVGIETVKGIIKFINEELKYVEAEEMGETYSPNTLREFPKQNTWPRKYEGQD